MASALYRLGRFSARRRGWVVATWVALLVALGGLVATVDTGFVDSFSIPGTESQEAIELLDERMPGAGGASGRIVFAADEGERIEDARAEIDAVMAKVAEAPNVVAAASPFVAQSVSPDGRVALAQVNWSVESIALTQADRDAVRDIAAEVEGDGLTVEFGGDAGLEVTEPGGIAEGIGFAIAAVVLAITFGAMVAAGLPLLTAIIGVGVGVLGITLASAFLDLSSSVQAMALMLGLAVGIDYALFVLSRHRSQLFDGVGVEESIGRAVGTAGSAVVFAGLTVIIALAALTVVGIPFMSAMGLAASATVAVAVLIAITLLPALMSFAGMRLRKGKNFETGPRSLRPTMGARWVRTIVRHRIPTVIAGVAVLAVLAVPALDLRLALPDDSSASTEQTTRRAYDQVRDGFGPGFSGPLMVVVDGGEGGGVAGRAGEVAEQLRAFDGVANVAEPVVNEAGDTAIVSVIPESGPAQEATRSLVKEIRDTAADDVTVTGQTAMNIDVSEKMSGAMAPYLAVIVVLAFLLLLVAFRSIIVPIKAIAGFLLTIAATFGAVVFTFQQGHLAGLLGIDQPNPIVSMLPVLVIGILFGLAMDYEMFLVSRMREEHMHGLDATESVVEGFRHGARVVTAAGLIMVAVFAGFIFEHDQIIKSLGFALAFGILVDAFVVRMTIVPAVMSLLGERAWWFPRWLDRIVPNVDIEGSTLRTPDSEVLDVVGADRESMSA
jgi:RND superfamily putative drug exporter